MNHGFYGLLLMHMHFGLDEDCQTAYTDGYRINFSPKFLDELSNDEVDFVLMHEIMHVVFKHCFRGQKADPYLFNVACDIVVNSNILLESNSPSRKTHYRIEQNSSLSNTDQGKLETHCIHLMNSQLLYQTQE